MGIPISGVGAAGAAVTVTVPGRRQYRTRITGANVSMSVAPAAAVGFTMTEVQNNSVRFTLDLAAVGPQNLYPPEDGWEFEVGQDVALTLAAPGGAVIGKVNAGYSYVPEANPYT